MTSDQACADLCNLQPACKSFSINASTRVCSLLSSHYSRTCDLRTCIRGIDNINSSGYDYNSDRHADTTSTESNRTAQSSDGTKSDPDTDVGATTELQHSVPNGDASQICDPVTCAEYNGDVIYTVDTAGLYCATNALDCARLREYYHCKLDKTCVFDQDVAHLRERCTTLACSTEQCGLPQPCAATSDESSLPGTQGDPLCANTTDMAQDEREVAAACAEGFRTCGAGCACVFTYTGCMIQALDSLFDATKVDVVSGLSAQDMCDREGCAPADCGLQVPSLPCAQVAVECAQHHSACVSFAYMYWANSGSTEAGISAFVLASEGTHTVLWPPLGQYDHAGIRASHGVREGRYYWETVVSGACAVVGVVDDMYDTTR